MVRTGRLAWATVMILPDEQVQKAAERFEGAGQAYKGLLNSDAQGAAIEFC